MSDLLDNYRGMINEALQEFVVEESPEYPALYKAAHYALNSGGKRLRPMLTLATAEVFDATPQRALVPACCIEAVHTYSLIHDDLPCIDDDEMRRGKPTIHVIYDEGHAVLTGDYLLTLAFEKLGKASFLSETQKLQLIIALAEGAGGNGMIGGQMMDISTENQSFDLNTLQLMHLKKTGALIRTSILFGAIIGKGSRKELALLTLFGDEVGIAFQIIDDVLDATNSSDAAHRKTTYATLLGIEKAQEAAEQHLNQGLAHLTKINRNTLPLKILANSLVHRNL